MNNARIICGEVDESYGYFHNLHGKTFGEWTGQYQCPHTTYVCRIQTQMAPIRGTGHDDTAINGVKFFCCSYKKSKL